MIWLKLKDTWEDIPKIKKAVKKPKAVINSTIKYWNSIFDPQPLHFPPNIK